MRVDSLLIFLQMRSSLSRINKLPPLCHIRNRGFWVNQIVGVKYVLHLLEFQPNEQEIATQE